MIWGNVVLGLIKGLRLWVKWDVLLIRIKVIMIMLWFVKWLLLQICLINWIETIRV